jgi:starch phosphorylase
VPEVGWALGDGQEHGEDAAWDAAEAQALYDLLEHQVIPEFYARDGKGIPSAWVARMRESMARLTPHFSSYRSASEYTEQHYLPAASAYRKRASGKGALGVQIVNWCHELDQKWAALRFGKTKVKTEGGRDTFEVQVFLNGLDPKSVRVELYAEVAGSAPLRQEMRRVCPSDVTSAGDIYSVTVPAGRALGDYTARAMPQFDDVAIPLESRQILWQR